ncbi:MAG: rhodanese-like domain-containing protein [Gallionella sp.]
MSNAVNGYKIISAAELQAMMKQGGIHLVDVRTEAEVARGKIPQGDPLPLHLLPLRLNGLDKNATTVFYCQMGGRSAQAAAFAAEHGFVDVYNLQGGIAEWASAGLPIES